MCRPDDEFIAIGEGARFASRDAPHSITPLVDCRSDDKNLTVTEDTRMVSADLMIWQTNGVRRTATNAHFVQQGKALWSFTPSTTSSLAIVSIQPLRVNVSSHFSLPLDPPAHVLYR